MLIGAPLASGGVVGPTVPKPLARDDGELAAKLTARRPPGAA